MSSSAYFYPKMLAQFPEVAAVVSLRDTARPGSFSMLYGASEDVLTANRAVFAHDAGFASDRLAFPRLEHQAEVTEIDNNYSPQERPAADIIMTNRSGWLIGVAVADCVAILLYDPEHHAVAAAHSGWRGSAANVVKTTLEAMRQRYGTDPAKVLAYLSPAPNRDEYEVGHDEVSARFDPKYSTSKGGGKDWFDNRAVIVDQLLAAGVTSDHLEIDQRSTIADPQLHSYRRDGQSSGRMLVAIGVRETAGKSA